ncbi:hypothetical protein ID866_13009 [Astraeus odoratus]|nr:hypothetical protein ID866_13009 [Astraeus odoratus]
MMQLSHSLAHLMHTDTFIWLPLACVKSGLLWMNSEGQ